LYCDVIQAIGFLFSTRWINLDAVVLDNFCIAQGVLKQIADVGTATWTFVIAVHTFCLLVLKVKPNRFTLFATLIAGWSGICAIVISGPTMLDTVDRGPFFGISGYWCWISEGFSVPRVTLDTLFMFMAAFLCFILHVLVFLVCRGNMTLKGWRMSFHIHARQRPADVFEDKGMAIAKQMSLYPLAYSILIIPLAISRLAASSGHTVPFEEIVFCETVYLLSGCIKVIIFCTSRQILPPESVLRSVSNPKPIEPVEPDHDSDSTSDAHYAPDPYYEPSVTVVGYGFSEKYKEEGFDLEGGTTSKTVSIGMMSHSSAGASIPYEHTVTPLQIRKTVRRPRPPSVLVPNRRINSAGGVENFYSVYPQGHRENVNIGPNRPPGPYSSYR
jgi:hypothetical protein